jgi:iron complex outermembrane receptor protein
MKEPSQSSFFRLPHFTLQKKIFFPKRSAISIIIPNFATLKRGALILRAENKPIEPDTGSAGVGSFGNFKYLNGFPFLAILMFNRKMRKLMKKLILTCIFATALWHIGAQSNLRGKVYDKQNNETLAGAHVVVEESYKVASSDKNGYFEIKGCKTDSLIVKISFLGYQTLVKSISINDNIEHKFYLEPTTIMNEEIIILSTRWGENTPTAHTNINKAEVQKLVDARNIGSMIEFTPSVVTTSDAGTGIGNIGYRIRGTDETRINVTINNVPLNDPESQGAWFVNLPDFGSSVDNIQIQRGVGTSTNGSGAFGGSINFQTTKLNNKAYAEINEFVGSYNTFKHNLNFGTGLIADKFAFDGRISKITSDGYIDRGYADLNSSYFSGAYYGKKTMIKALALLGSQETYQTWDGIPSQILDTNRTWNGIGMYKDSEGNTKFYDNETDNYKQNHFHILISHDINTQLNINSTIFYTRGIGYYEQYKQNRKYSEYGFENQIVGRDTIKRTDFIRRKYLDNNYYGANIALTYQSQKIPLQIVYGVSGSQFDNDHYGDVIWMKIAGDIDNNTRFYEGNGLKTEASTFLKTNYMPTKELNLWLDLQGRFVNYKIDGINDKLLDITQEHNWNFFNPKAGISYNINSSNTIFTSFAVAQREPTRTNLVDAPYGETPTSEMLYDYEIGHQLRLNKFSLQSNLYYMDYKNQLVLTGEINNTGAAIMTNVDKSYRTGIEIVGQYKPIKNLAWNFNFTLSRNKIENFVEYVDDWDTGIQRVTELGTTDLAFSPEIIASHSLEYYITKQLSVSYIQKYVGKQYIDNTSNEDHKLNPYFLNNIQVRYGISKNWLKNASLVFMANNIFNYKYETNAWIYRYYSGNEHKFEDGYFPQAGRNFMLGISLAI